MTLREDWQLLVRRAWSIRLIVLAGILSGLEVAEPLIQPFIAIPQGVFAALAGITTCAAFVARIIAQREFNE